MEGLTWRDVLYQWAHLLESIDEYMSECLRYIHLYNEFGVDHEASVGGCGTQELECNFLVNLLVRACTMHSSRMLSHIFS
jgi:hypothetical protein